MSEISGDFYIGEDVTIEFTVTTDGTTAQNVSGWTTSFKLIDPNDDTTEVTRSGSVIDAATGRINVTFSSSHTAALAPGRYPWFFVRTDSSSYTVLAKGELVLHDAPAWA